MSEPSLSALMLPPDLNRADRSQMHVDFLMAAVIGCAAALVAFGFRMGSKGLHWLFTQHTTTFTQTAMALSPLQRVLVPTLGGLLAGLILYFGMRLHRGQSAKDYMEAITVGDGSIPVRSTLVKCFSSLFSIASGAAIGREGPLVQLAAMAGSLPGRLFGFVKDRRRLYVACGAAAGIASAYNAPIAGALFVSEIVLGSIAIDHFGPLVFSSVTATVVTRDLLGEAPIFSMPPLALVSHGELLAHCGLGVLAGMAGPAFLALLDGAEHLFGRLNWPAYLKLTLGGLIVGLVSVAEPRVWGNGYSVVSSILHENWLISALLLMLVFKLIATASAIGSGAVGGVFTPTLFVGAVLGALVGTVMGYLFPHYSAPVPVYVMIGMGAFLSATTHAPMTAILMIFEMTLEYSVVLPLMLACVIANYVAQAIQPDSIYSDSLRRKTSQQEESPEYFL